MKNSIKVLIGFVVGCALSMLAFPVSAGVTMDMVDMGTLSTGMMPFAMAGMIVNKGYVTVKC